VGKQGMISADSKPRLILSGEFVEGKKLRHIDALEKSAIKNSTGKSPAALNAKCWRSNTRTHLIRRKSSEKAGASEVPAFSHHRRFVLCRATTVIRNRHRCDLRQINRQKKLHAVLLYFIAFERRRR
jgi:hypothetical protein